MHKVILFPSKCPSSSSWIKQHKEREGYEVADNQFRHHAKHGCMKELEHYLMITKEKKKCKECGQFLLKREKVIVK